MSAAATSGSPQGARFASDIVNLPFKFRWLELECNEWPRRGWGAEDGPRPRARPKREAFFAGPAYSEKRIKVSVVPTATSP
jgi:hypothetical protein